MSHPILAVFIQLLEPPFSLFSGVSRLFHLHEGSMKIRPDRALFLLVCQRTEMRRPPIDILYLRLGIAERVAVLIEL